MIATILEAAPASAAMSSTPFVAIFTVFVLAIFVGYYVVSVSYTHLTLPTTILV